MRHGRRKSGKESNLNETKRTSMGHAVRIADGAQAADTDTAQLLGARARLPIHFGLSVWGRSPHGGLRACRRIRARLPLSVREGIGGVWVGDSDPTSFMPNTSQYRAPGLQLKGCQLLNFNFLEHPTPEARNPEATLGSARRTSAVYDLKQKSPSLETPLFDSAPSSSQAICAREVLSSYPEMNIPDEGLIALAHMSLSFESKTPIRPALMIILPPSHQRASRSLDSDTGNEGGSIGRACSDIDPRRHKARQAFPSPTATIRKAYRLSCLRAPPVHGTLSPFVDEAWDNMLPLWCKDARLSNWAPDYTGSRATGISPTANFSLSILSHAAPTTDDASPPPRKLPPTLATLPVSRGSGSGDAPTKPSLQCDAFPLSVFSHSLVGPLVAVPVSRYDSAMHGTQCSPILTQVTRTRLFDGSALAKYIRTTRVIEKSCVGAVTRRSTGTFVSYISFLVHLLMTTWGCLIAAAEFPEYSYACTSPTSVSFIHGDGNVGKWEFHLLSVSTGAFGRFGTLLPVAAKPRNPALGECRTRVPGPALFATCCGRLALALSAPSAESSRDSREISRHRDRMQTGCKGKLSPSHFIVEMS
ncbi:hypothetical protein DFH09DRAFT_1086878 [Mycena vulgaris]|nr:hypothetical protein DFH09DRAFT_1086878 [Mycena vulgaris]